ncbi:MAG: beta-glucosidase, partial [Oligoflexia bacterium]|nr:beta-glucosidase [Oligoflexia bacterium]
MQTFMRFMRITILFFLTTAAQMSLCAEPKEGNTASRIKKLLEQMTLEEKIGQMVQAERKTTTPEDVKNYFLGSLLSGGGSSPGSNQREDWLAMVNEYQQAALSTRMRIPILYGIDAVHGHNNVYGAVIFPHNIGLGAANDPALMERIAAVTAEEVLATGITWIFSPCVAIVKDPRWGRYYESFGDNQYNVSRLALPLVRTVQNQYKMITSVKHFLADGAAEWGTGDNGYPIDQGNTQMSEEEIRRVHMYPYVEAIKAGAKTVMISYGS